MATTPKDNNDTKTKNDPTHEDDYVPDDKDSDNRNDKKHFTEFFPEKRGTPLVISVNFMGCPGSKHILPSPNADSISYYLMLLYPPYFQEQISLISKNSSLD